jgi:hypothetical protein
LEYQLQNKHGIHHPTNDQIYDFGLFLIDKIMRQGGKSLDHFADMPQIMGQWQDVIGNRFIAEQRDYDPVTEQEQATINIAMLNPEQKRVYDEIFHSATNGEGGLFFVNGPGGTGKSFTWNTLAYSIRGRSLIVLCIASSGIAALILIGGRTSHAMFKIPIQIHEGSLCDIKRGSALAELLKQVSLIIWDEVPMQHRHVVEAVDRTCRDILEHPDRPFGGITVAWGGDFQQTLPVVPRGNKEEIVGASIQRSPLWRHVKVLHLTQNMRVDPQDPQSAQFAQWLCDVGQGNNLPLDNSLTLPQHMVCGPQISDLIATIYPNIGTGEALQDKYFLERAILCPRNMEVDEINAEVLKVFPGIERLYSSADSVKGAEDGNMYPVEYLNSLNMGGLPPSQLCLKPGVVLMLLRNLDLGRGLCNGTRLRLINMTHRVLFVRIISGSFAGQTAFIPRITVSPSSEQLPFELQRRQFPVRLAFAMTINKSQGQSLGTVGIDLRSPVFSHGQFYVAVSRGTNWGRVHILLGEGNKTSNIVFKEVLLKPA